MTKLGNKKNNTSYSIRLNTATDKRQLRKIPTNTMRDILHILGSMVDTSWEDPNNVCQNLLVSLYDMEIEVHRSAIMELKKKQKQLILRE